MPDTQAIKRKVMVVSNEPSLLQFLKANLDKERFQVSRTRETKERLKVVLDEQQPDLVIIDIGMPEMQGVPTSLLIRQWSAVPTILLTTWKAGKDKVRSLDVNAEGCLSTPFGINELMAWINQAIN